MVTVQGMLNYVVQSKYWQVRLLLVLSVLKGLLENPLTMPLDRLLSSGIGGVKSEREEASTAQCCSEREEAMHGLSRRRPA